jgi:hypothetical protein
MRSVLLEITDFAKGMSFQLPTEPSQALTIINNPVIIIAAIVLIIATVLILLYLKDIITNSIMGGIIWAASVFIFHVELPLIPSFMISVIFGPAGVGAMLILKALGLLV